MSVHRAITVNVEEKRGTVLSCGHDNSVSLIIQESSTDDVIVRFTAFHLPQLRELIQKVERMEEDRVTEVIKEDEADYANEEYDAAFDL
jgi:hypothetical protein